VSLLMFVLSPYKDKVFEIIGNILWIVNRHTFGLLCIRIRSSSNPILWEVVQKTRGLKSNVAAWQRMHKMYL
jgi:hypothetical protein